MPKPLCSKHLSTAIDFLERADEFIHSGELCATDWLPTVTGMRGIRWRRITIYSTR